jgi:integrase
MKKPPKADAESKKRTPRHNAGLPLKNCGRWRIRPIGPDGRRLSRTFATYGEALDELHRIQAQTHAVKSGVTPAPTRSLTFGAFYKKYWLPNHGKQKRSAKSDTNTYKVHVAPFFADLPLNQCTTATIEKFRAGLKRAHPPKPAKKKTERLEVEADGPPDQEKKDAALSPATVRNVLALVSAVLHYAHGLGELPALPHFNRPKAHVKEFAYLRNDDEIRRFLAAAKKRDESVKELSDKAQERRVPVYALYATAVFSGLRLGELCGLRWRDVNFSERMMTVSRSYNRPTKSGDVRFVPLVDALAPILKAWKLEAGGVLVFPTTTGAMRGPMDWVFQDTFHEVLADAGLPRLRFHDLRHSFAAAWVSKGGDLYRLQKVLGHHSQSMVQRYSHLAPNAFDGLRGIFGDKPPATESAEVQEITDARRKRGRAPQAK